MVAWAGALLTGNTKETGDIVLRPVQVCLLIAYYKYINIFLFNQEALLITKIYPFQNALRIPKQILDLLHQKEMGRQELACFPLNMMAPQRINVCLNRIMVAWLCARVFFFLCFAMFLDFRTALLAKFISTPPGEHSHLPRP